MRLNGEKAMKELNEVIHNLKRHVEQKSKLSGVEFANDVIEAFQAINLRLSAIEQRSVGQTPRS
jgi:hypothetical protein